MSPPEKPSSTPEGTLIRLARKARGLSAKEAAARTPIRLSESRWYHIEAGQESRGKPVSAPAETIAHMARVVGVTPERLSDAGQRPDAAEILREILLQDQTGAPPAPVEVMDVPTDQGLVMIPVPPDMPEADREELRRWGQQMARYLAERRISGDTED